MGFPGGSVVKNLPAWQEVQEMWLHPWVGKIPWRRAWQPTPVLLPGESHGLRSLVGYSPLGHKESDMTKWLSTHTHVTRRYSNNFLNGNINVIFQDNYNDDMKVFVISVGDSHCVLLAVFITEGNAKLQLQTSINTVGMYSKNLAL